MNYFFGVDVGGTFVKIGLIDECGTVMKKGQIDTGKERGPEYMLDNIAAYCIESAILSGITMSDVKGCGVCLPGIIDSEEGVVMYSGNIEWHRINIVAYLENKLGVPVKITNDANAAALGEARFGAAKGIKDSIFVTLGTGVGGGIISDGKLIVGRKSAGAEVGHIIIQAFGEPCSCGSCGCFEAYCSATALIRDTKRAMEENKKSLLYQVADRQGHVDGKTAFIAEKEGDATAKKVVERYIAYLAVGLSSLSSIFRPEVIMLGGGISNEGDNLILRTQAKLDSMIFAGKIAPSVRVVRASLGNDAGFMGAAALNM